MDESNPENQSEDLFHDPRSAAWWKAVSAAIVEREADQGGAWPEELSMLGDQVASLARRAGGMLSAETLEAIEAIAARCDAIEARLDRIETQLGDRAGGPAAR